MKELTGVPPVIASQNWDWCVGDSFWFFRTLTLSHLMECAFLIEIVEFTGLKLIKNSHLYCNSTITELCSKHDTCGWLFHDFTNLVQTVTSSFITFLEVVIIHGSYFVVQFGSYRISWEKLTFSQLVHIYQFYYTSQWETKHIDHNDRSSKNGYFLSRVTMYHVS